MEYPDTHNQADVVSLLFITQKNGIKGESIRHGRTDHPQGYPVAAVHHHVVYLQRNASTVNTPLHSIKYIRKWQQILSTEIMSAICAIIQSLGPSIGFTAADVRTMPLQAGGYNGYPNCMGGPGEKPPCGEVSNQQNALLPPYHRKKSQTASPSAFSSTVIMSSYHHHILVSSAMRCRRASFCPPKRGFWGPGIGLVWPWKYQN